jgi:SAM-dependent methyltransferase
MRAGRAGSSFAMSEIPYIIRGGLSGRERLRILSGVLRPSTSALLDRVGVPDGARCLDVGCGGGDVSLELAARGGRVVGVDVDEEKLAIAREEAAAAGLDVEYRHADITSEDVGSGFDLCYCRFLLTHLTDPAGAVRRLHGALRPGGALVVEDIDYGGSVSYPDSAVYRRYCDIYVATAELRGCDPHIGPRLPSLLRGAGVQRIEATAVQPMAIEGDVKLACALTLENIADAAVAEGVAERGEIEQVATDLHRQAADRVTLMSFPRIVQVWGYTEPR